MAKLKKTWREKLEDAKELPRVEVVTPEMSARWGTGTVVIPAPIEVDGIMRSVPAGKLITINQIRVILAKRHNASFGCPLTTGIFVGIAAKAAEEDISSGKTDITPYWRTVKEKGELNEKYPGGAAAQAAYLKDEGHVIELKGKKSLRVKDYEKVLVDIK